jgi:lysophospholipase
VSAPPLEAAPLIPTPGADLPPGQAEWFTGVHGARLRAALFPARNPIGSVVLSPGRTEHIEKYVEVIGELVGRGFTVLVHDWRGQGLSARLLSDRLRGHADGFGDFVADYRGMLDIFEPHLPKPWIALAHSMGGCLALTALARGERRFAAAIMSAPMWGINAAKQLGALARPVTWVVAHAGWRAVYALGNAYDPESVPFEADKLTHDRPRHDRSRAQIIATPDVQLGGVTWGWVASAVGAIGWLGSARAVTSVDIPVTVVAAGDDLLVDNVKVRAVTARLPHGKYIEVPGSYHEILIETDDIRAVFWREFDALVAPIVPKRAKAKAPAKGKPRPPK